MPHSEAYFVPSRDAWWNQDYLTLLAQRTGLCAARRVLDVGAGVGHFTRTIASVLPAGFQVTGIERERAWVERAQRESGSARGTLTFVQGDAHELPFASESFDAVVCQTVLMHLRDPRLALAEMCRVLKPRGIALLVEPNNVASNLAALVDGAEFDVEGALAFAKLEMLCERGKAALGEGFNSLGESLPKLVGQAGLQLKDVWLNDKCQVLSPPYDSPLARAALSEHASYRDREMLIWSKQETRRYFLAGGGREQDFDGLWGPAFAAWYARLEAAQEGRFASAGGSLVYVLFAQKEPA